MHVEKSQESEGSYILNCEDDSSFPQNSIADSSFEFKGQSLQNNENAIPTTEVKFTRQYGFALSNSSPDT